MTENIILLMILSFMIGLVAGVYVLEKITEDMNRMPANNELSIFYENAKRRERIFQCGCYFANWYRAGKYFEELKLCNRHRIGIEEAGKRFDNNTAENEFVKNNNIPYSH